MEQIGKILQEQLSQLQVEKAQEQSNSLSVSNIPSSATPEVKILILKYAAKQIGQMNAQEVESWGMALLVKIHVITGWTIPPAELLNILVDQFQKKLVESYPTMNPDEIEYAFRTGGTTVKDWGKSMNLALIDEVLIPYLDERKRLSHELEERSKAAPATRIYTEEEMWNIHRGDVEAFYQRLLNGWIPKTKTPEYFAVILRKDGLLRPDETTDAFFMRRLNARALNIYIHEPKKETDEK